ncbi:dTDP-4-amino-4,6-dideoxygalactose transaminase [Solirubrobacter pauli]|uniref:dTDP-4-amino-4,6-dideoxygalactose transaminase n=1 Tax=Solirubrobacter pauli TaxID=166793 RepID=A0A660LCV6_9ACTN|nr:DegT/DnrJ/EryC1/StrS aminotransferase family protein [Solirubrobacter pauli]RKQ92898.1 dTDP-4-amino-4,6-dideoxygalactose transaminase [Solirubrobacter pauli]
MTSVPFQRPSPAGLEQIAAHYARSEAVGWYTRGPCVEELGRRAGALGGGYGVPVSSATSGLMLALRALSGAGDGRLVAIPSFTCAAVPGAVEWSGFRPLFVDVEPDGWHVDPAALEAAVEGREVAAVLVSATFGTPPPAEQLAGWASVAGAHGLPLIYDAAAGLGAADPFGALTAYSFEATKPAGFGEGGVLVTPDPKLAEELRRLANYGLRDGVVNTTVGINAKLSELGAAAGLAAMDGLEHLVAERRARGLALQEALRGADVRFQHGCEHSAWSATHVVVGSPRKRDAALTRARSLGVETRTLWDPPLHRHAAWSHAEHGGLAVTEHLAARSLALPMAADLTEAEIARIAEVFVAA